MEKKVYFFEDVFVEHFAGEGFFDEDFDTFWPALSAATGRIFINKIAPQIHLEYDGDDFLIKEADYSQILGHIATLSDLFKDMPVKDLLALYIQAPEGVLEKMYADHFPAYFLADLYYLYAKGIFQKVIELTPVSAQRKNDYEFGIIYQTALCGPVVVNHQEQIRACYNFRYYQAKSEEKVAELEAKCREILRCNKIVEIEKSETDSYLRHLLNY